MANEFMNVKFTPEEQKGFDACETPNEIADFLRSLHGPAPEEQAVRDANGRFMSAHSGVPDAAAAKAAADAKTAADAKAAAATREFKKTVSIAGQDFEFTATSAENLQLQIDSATAVAEQLHADTPAPVRNIADEVWKSTQLAEQFRSGAITPEQYLQASGALEAAVAKHMQDAGIDLPRLAGEQFERTWAEAAHSFVASPEGKDWPGGVKNQELLALKIAELGLVDAQDKVAACAQAYAVLKAKGMLYDGDVSPAEIEKLVEGATPQEIVQVWKDKQDVKHGDATEANEAFIASFRNGRSSSGLFGR